MALIAMAYEMQQQSLPGCFCDEPDVVQSHCHAFDILSRSRNTGMVLAEARVLVFGR